MSAPYPYGYGAIVSRELTLDIEHINNCAKVTKPWGHEIWLQDGTSVHPYALKQLTLTAGKQTSLQVHQFKSETVLILSGKGILEYWDGVFDCDTFLKGLFTDEYINQLKQNLTRVEIAAGSVFNTPPNVIHRMIADEDLVYVEASTTQLDDVIRLEDSNKRPHGRIEAEHAR